MKEKDALKAYLEIASQKKFKGWPMVPGSFQQGPDIKYFGSTITYELETGNGIESYTSIIRSFGWCVVFGLTEDGEVITLVQWKPGVNKASWELPPGGIGKLAPDTPLNQIEETTKASYLKETGYGAGSWEYLGNVAIETAKFRGAGPDDHGLYAHLYLATGLQKMQEQRSPNLNEIIETLLVPVGEFLDVLDSGHFVETSAVACAYKALRKLGLLRGNPLASFQHLEHKLIDEDERRAIYEVNFSASAVTKIIVKDGGRPLGQHFHQDKYEDFYVVAGRGILQTCAVGPDGEASSPITQTVLLPGSGVHIPPNTAHRLDLKIGTILIGASSAAYDPNDMLAFTLPAP